MWYRDLHLTLLSTGNLALTFSIRCKCPFFNLNYNAAVRITSTIRATKYLNELYATAYD
jgi:hypothetical protein